MSSLPEERCDVSADGMSAVLVCRFETMSTGMPEVSNMEEPPYKKNLERLAALQDRLSKVQKTAESLLATVSGSGGDYTDKLVYTDVTRVQKYLETNKVHSIHPQSAVSSEHRCERAVCNAELKHVAVCSLRQL